MQVARKLYTSSSESRSVDTTDLVFEGSAYGRHVYMSYGLTVARAIREGYGPSVPSFRDQVALQRAFQSLYATSGGKAFRRCTRSPQIVIPDIALNNAPLSKRSVDVKTKEPDLNNLAYFTHCFSN